MYNKQQLEYIIHDHYVKISSAGRNITKYPLHYDYRIDFQTPFRNVIKVEMISCVIPDANVTSEPIIVFDIKELNFMNFISSAGYKTIFSAFPISEPNAQNHTFINLKAQGPVLIYKIPLASLSSLTIKLYDIDYQPLTFGEPAGSTAKLLQHAFILKVSVQEISLDPIQSRNVRRDN